MGMESSDRRRSARQAETWCVLFGTEGQLFPGYVVDMSPAGVSILCERPFPVGTEVQVHFGIDENQNSGRLQMHGVVRHHTAGRIGVPFLNVDPSQREHWWEILRGAR